MLVRFRCPHCKKLLAIGTHKAGSRIQCPKCARPVPVPHPMDVESPITTCASASTKDGTGEALLPAPTRGESAVKMAVPAPEGSLPTTPFFTRKHICILAGGTVAALFVVVGALALLGRPSPKTPSLPSPQVAQVSDAEESPQIDPQPQPEQNMLPIVIPEEKPSEPSEPDQPAVPKKKPDPPVVPPVPAPTVKLPLPLPATKKPAPAGKMVVKSRRETNEDQLRRQLDEAPEISLDRGNERAQAQRAVALARAAKQIHGRLETISLLVKNRPDLAGLPLLMGDDCHLTLTAAEHLQGGSTALKAHLTAATASNRRGRIADGHPDPKHLAELLMDDGQRFNKWLKPEGIPALQQLLMAEDQATREVLVDQLSRIDGKRASLALAQHALFDLHPNVRAGALSALAKRPHAEYRSALLAGFRHPWSVVADHAAEALVALGVREAVPALVGLLEQPHPAAPYKKPGREGMYVREMACLNHFRNCLLCHPASLNSDDKVRGAVPRLDQAISGESGGGYGAQPQSIFVRADITYLRQDFSVQRPVENHGLWPAVQRFDYLVRERPATSADVHAARALETNGPSEHQKAIFFALRELTGADPGPSVEDWKRLFLRKAKVKRVRADLALTGGVAADPRGRVWLSAVGEILLDDPNNAFGPWLKDMDGCKGLALDSRGRLLVCQTAKGRLIAIDLHKQTLDVLADRYKGKPLHGPRHLVIDRQGGVYFTDAAVPTPDNAIGVGGAVYYLSAQGTLTRLPIALAAPVGIALSPNEKMLYLSWAGSRDVMAYPLEGAGLPGQGRVFGQMEARGDALAHVAGGLTVDGEGKVFLVHAAKHALEVFNSEGARLGLISLPDAPLACAFGDAEGKTLYVVSRHAMYKVQLEDGLTLVRQEE